MDEGHELTEKELQKLEKRITAEYRQAAREVAAKYEAWNAKFAAADAKQQAKLAAGEISKADYQQWVLRQRMIGSDWKTMSDTLAKDLVNADNIARKMIGEEMPNVYALNANYGTYQIEHTGIDTGFTLYNHDTAEVLLKQENIALMPGPTGSRAEMLREAADLKWNRQKINSAVLQGVLQGEGAKKVAQRLMGVAQMDANAAIRYARTMTTSAQNAGRYQSYRRAKALGIDLTIEWQATLDNRTRHEHRMMHGQRREVDEPFEVSGFKILYPAEAKGKSSDIPQNMIWNCRCTLLAWVKGFEPDTVKSSPKMQGMTFEEWQMAKAPKGISDKFRATNMTKAVPKVATLPTDNAKKVLSVNETGTAMLQRAYDRYTIENGLKRTSISELKSAEIGKMPAANYGKIAPEVAQSWNTTIGSLIEEYNSPLSEIRLKSGIEVLANKNAFASTSTDYGMGMATISINPLKMGNNAELTARLQELRAKKWIAPVPEARLPEYIPTHEFAHTFMQTEVQYSAKANFVGVDIKTQRAVQKEIKALYAEYRSEVASLSAEFKAKELAVITGDGTGTFDEALAVKKKLDAVKISEYSLASADEFMAEAFASERLGGLSNAYTQRAVEIIDRYYRR